MPRHVPHVCDSGRCLTATCRRIEGDLGPFRAVVPEMDAVVMARMRGYDGEHLLKQCVDCQVTGQRTLVLAVEPQLQPQPRLGLEVVWKFVEDPFQGAGVGLVPLFVFVLSF